MTRALPQSLRALAMFGAAALFAPAATATAPEHSKAVDGVALYLGVLPSELIQGHPADHPEARMHGGKPSRRESHHVIVALFDDKTGKRIADAEVRARVMETGLGATEKKLEPMTIADTVTYGNYFSMAGSANYRIQVFFRRPGSSKVSEAVFQYRHTR